MKSEKDTEGRDFSTLLCFLFKIENSIEQPFLPTKEFNISIVLVFITDLLIAITLMGYNLYIPVYLQEKLSLSPLQSGFVIFPLSVAWITLNFNLAKIEAHFTRKTLYICSFFVLLVCSLMIMFGLIIGDLTLAMASVAVLLRLWVRIKVWTFRAYMSFLTVNIYNIMWWYH